MSPASAQQLWSKLAAAGLTVGNMPETQETHTPWYVRVMLGVAGFIAAVFLLGFVGVGFAFVLESKAACLAVGFMMIAAAYAVFRAAPHSDFGSMFALAVSFAGQALVAYGVWGVLNQRSSQPWLAISVIEAILALAMPNFIHRVVSAYAAVLALAVALASSGAVGVAGGLVALAVAGLWLNEVRLAKHHAVVTPIGYGLTLAFIQVEGSNFTGHSVMAIFGSQARSWAMPWMGEALVVAAFLFAVWTLLRRAGWTLSESKSVLSLAIAAAIGAASFKAPGVAGGLMIVLVGFANGNRLLAGLGIAALLYYVSSYYYLLDATLLAKAGVLAASGVVLLAARWLLLTVIMPKGASADA
jgi:uncharacterized membrane protein